MHYVLILILLLILLFGPQWWAQYTFQHYAKPLKRIPGTGGELAKHLLQRFDMQDVKVEIAEHTGDHYDPRDKTVRLTKSNFENNSLTAVAVASHEVGHAIQHHRNESLLSLRTRLATFALLAQKAGSAIFILMPLVAGITRAPSVGVLMIGVVVGSMLLGVFIHLVTLPVEWDASFAKALPILKEGYIEEEDQRAVEKILRAAALTYLAGSLASVLNLWRWLMILRR